MAGIIARFPRASSRARRTQSAQRPSARPGNLESLESRILFSYRVFLALDGVTGDVNAKGFVGQMAVSNFQLSLTAGKTLAPQFTFTTNSDKALPTLLDDLAQSQSIRNGTLTVLSESALAAAPAPFETWNFSQVTVVNESSSIDTTDTLQVLHTFTLAFGSAQITTNQTAAGGSPIVRSVNINTIKQSADLAGTFPVPTSTNGSNFDLSLLSTDSVANPGVIHATSLNVGFSRPFSPTDAANGVVTKGAVVPDSVTITDNPSATSTPALINQLVTGRHTTRYTFTQSVPAISLTAGKGGLSPKASWLFDNDLVTSYSTAFDGDNLSESFALSPQIFTSIAYTPNQNGGSSTPASQSSYDLSKNIATYTPNTSATDTKRANSALQTLVFTPSVSVHPFVQPGNLVPQTATFGAANTNSSAKGAASATQTFSDFIVSRTADVSTPALFAALTAGSSWDNVLYTQRDQTIAVTGGSAPVDRLKLNLGVVGLGALQIAYTSGDPTTAVETAHYKFGELTTTALDAKGAQTSTSTFSTLTHSKSLRGVTTTALMSSVNPSMFGQPVTFTATVTGTSPTGTVTFRDGETVLNVATLSSGVATFTIATMDAGVHHITATYNGDLANKASATTPVIWPVHPAITTVKLLPRSSNNHVLSAHVTVAKPGKGPPTGFVKFYVNGIFAGHAPVNPNGLATLTLNSPAPGFIKAFFVSRNFALSHS